MKTYTNIIFKHFIFWIIALFIWSIMREFGLEANTGYENLQVSENIRISIALGIVAGILFGSLEYVYDKYIFKNLSFSKALLINIASYLVIIFIILIVGIRMYYRITDRTFYFHDFLNNLREKNAILFICYLSFFGIFIRFMNEVNRKFGPGNLWRIIIGKYYRPKEEKRIFMFLDLKDSTPLAEKLGHIKYSQLIQDCFKDLAIVNKYDAEIYQYVGDEAVLTWKVKKGLKKEKCLKAFFSFKKRIYYRSLSSP